MKKKVILLYGEGNMKKFLPILISVFVIMTNMLCANATENILRGVNVSKENGTNKIELTSKAPAKMTKTVLASDRIIINLKNISVSSNAYTKFNNNPVIDNIILEPYGKDGVSVYIQGDNIASSTIEFKEPTQIESAEDTIKSSFTSLFTIFTDNTLKNKNIQFGILIFFLIVIINEIRFIKSKYDELKLEKAKMIKDIELTSDFKNYLPGFGRQGLNKPYTTPVYGGIVNTNIRTRKELTHFKTPETTTLNSLLYNKNREDKIINRIVNDIPTFGALSGIVKDESKTTITSPIEQSRLNKHIAHLEQLTKKYKENAPTQDIAPQKRLNEVY